MDDYKNEMMDYESETGEYDEGSDTEMMIAKCKKKISKLEEKVDLISEKLKEKGIMVEEGFEEEYEDVDAPSRRKKTTGIMVGLVGGPKGEKA